MTVTSADTVKTRHDRQHTERLHVDFKKKYTKTEKLNLMPMGVDFLNRKMYDKAIEIFNLMTHMSYAQYHLGICFLHEKKHGPALNCFLKALNLKNWEGGENKERDCVNFLLQLPNTAQSTEVLYTRGCDALDQQNYEEAYRLFSKLPKHGLTEYNLAQSCMQLQKWDEAILHYQNVITANFPWDHCDKKMEIQNNAKYNIGLLKNAQARETEEDHLVTEAREAFLQCKQPYTGFVAQQVGMTYELQKNVVEALKYYRLALDAEWPGLSDEEKAITLSSLKGMILKLEAIMFLA